MHLQFGPISISTVSLLGVHTLEDVIFHVANTVHLSSAVHTPVEEVSTKVKVT